MEDLRAEPAAAGKRRQGRDRDRADRCDPQAGDDLRRRERQLDPPEDLALGLSHSARRILDRRRDVGEADEGVAVDDLEVEGGQGDHRGVDAAAGEGQQQEEEGDAGDRVEDPGRGQQRGLQPVAPVGDQGQGEGDREPDRDGEQDQLQMLDGRCPVAADVFRAQSKQKSFGGGRLAGQRFARPFVEERRRQFAGGGKRESSPSVSAIVGPRRDSANAPNASGDSQMSRTRKVSPSNRAVWAISPSGGFPFGSSAESTASYWSGVIGISNSMNTAI